MREIGEKPFLASLLPTLPLHPSFTNGFGHDASILDLGLAEMDLVLKIDRAARPVSAINGWSDYRVWGRLAVTANCSDVMAVGGEPRAFLLSISIPDDTASALVGDIIRGAAEQCAAMGVAFVGGDTKAAAVANVVGSALGSIPKGAHFDRRAGKEGDLLVLSGSIGGFLGAYWMCQSSPNPPAQALAYLSYPTAPWAEGRAMSRLRTVRSASDLSDGLAAAATSVTADGLGVTIDYDRLPFHALALESAHGRAADLLPYAFGVGDWGILYAVDPAALPELEALQGAGLSIAVIGKITGKPGLFLNREGRFKVHAPMHDHFMDRLEDQACYLRLHEQSIRIVPQAL